MSKLSLVLAFVLAMTFTLHAGEIPVTQNVPVAQTEQVTSNLNTELAPDQADDSSSEDAKKKRRKKKKKKKNPVVKWVVGGVVAAAAIALYILTDGEGWNSRG